MTTTLTDLTLPDLDDWEDPYDPVSIEKHEGVIVANDAPLEGGTKLRFVDYFVRNTKAKELVYGACPATGWAQVSLPLACARYGKKCTLFMANRNLKNLTNEQKLGLKYGAKYIWVQDGMLAVTNKRAKDYAAEDPENRIVFPIGIEHPTVLASIVKVARSLPLPEEPKEVWSVGSSGTLSRGLQMAFPNAEVNVVSVGHVMKKKAVGRAKLYRTKYDFRAKVKEEDRPPFSSVLTYDAKMWPFVREYATKADSTLVWNVAGDVSDIDVAFDLDEYKIGRIIIR